MTTTAQRRRVDRIEALLLESMARDRSKPARCHVGPDGVVTVDVSGRTVGLALALEWETGETFDAAMERLS